MVVRCKDMRTLLHSGPPIDRNDVRDIFCGDLLFYLFGGLYSCCISWKKAERSKTGSGHDEDHATEDHTQVSVRS